MTLAGLSTIHKATGDEKLRKSILSFGDKHSWDLCVGLRGGAKHADNQICAATYAELYLNSPAKNKTWVAATITHLHAELASPASIKSWFWVDAFFMAMSVYARIGALTGNTAYFNKMHANFQYAALQPHPHGYALWSQDQGLFYRDPPKGKPDGVFWSRGNGWAAAALVQAMKYSPAGEQSMGASFNLGVQYESCV
jgi:rhamnogalacturonyl hydrolase YesR